MSEKRYQGLGCNNCDKREDFGCRFSESEPQEQVILNLNPPLHFVGCPVEARIEAFSLLQIIFTIESSSLNLLEMDFVLVRLYKAFIQDRAEQEEYLARERERRIKNGT